MFETTLYGIFLLGASKSDVEERKKIYKGIHYEITYILILEFPWVLSLLWKNLT